MERFLICTAITAAAMLVGVSGCTHDRAASPPAPPAASATAEPSTQPQHAECLVCKYNADLACIDVAVDPGTPRTVWNGQTYYFCSESCKAKFEKNPQKYAGR